MSIKLIIIAVVLIIILIALVPVFIRRTVIATIEGFSWTRKVFLEHYIWVEDSSYSGFPDGSRNQQSTIESYYVSEIVSYNTQTTQINGVSSTTTTPVYGSVRRQRTKYTYEIQEWVPSRTLLSEGSEQNDVHWPRYTLDRSTSERIADTKETYLVFFQTAKGRQYKEKLPVEVWNTLDDTQEYELRVNLYGKITKLPKACDTIATGAAYDLQQQKMP
jgi:hypothetical protein